MTGLSGKRLYTRVATPYCPAYLAFNKECRYASEYTKA